MSFRRSYPKPMGITNLFVDHELVPEPSNGYNQVGGRIYLREFTILTPVRLIEWFGSARINFTAFNMKPGMYIDGDEELGLMTVPVEFTVPVPGDASEPANDEIIPVGNHYFAFLSDAIAGFALSNAQRANIGYFYDNPLGYVGGLPNAIPKADLTQPDGSAVAAQMFPWSNYNVSFSVV